MANSPAYGLSNYALTVQNSTANSTVFSNTITGSTEFTIDGQGNISSTSNTIVGRSLVFADGSVLSTASGASSVFDYTGDGVTTAFSTGNYSATSTLNTNVFISGVYQRKNQYTWTGTTITFTQPPPAGTAIEINIQTINTVITVPAAGSVTPSTLSTGGPSWDNLGNVTISSNLTVQRNLVFSDGSYLSTALANPSLFNYTGTGSQTVFATGNYSATSVLNTTVYVGSIYQSKSQYTWTGTNITFATAPPAGASIEIIINSVNSMVSTPAQGSVVPTSLSTGGPYWTAAGFLGVNTTSPSVQLEVNNSIRSTGNADIPARAGGSAYYTGGWGSPVSGRVLIGDGTGWKYNLSSRISSTTTDLFTFTDAGNMGMGTPNPESIGKLTVSGTSSTDTPRMGIVASDYLSTPTYTGTFLGQNGNSATGTTAGLSNAGLGYLLFQNVSNALVWTNGGTPIAFATGAIERMRISSSGLVGIGTNSPSYQLDIWSSGYSQLQLYGNSNGAQVGTRYRALNSDGSTNNIFTGVGLNANNQYLIYDLQTGYNLYQIQGTGTAAPYHAWYRNAGNEAMRIDTYGNLLVGTSTSTSAGYRMSIATGNTNYSLATNGINGFIYSNNEFDFAANLGQTSDIYINYRASTGAFTVSGYRFLNAGPSTYVPLYASAFTVTSDYRLKTNVQTMTSSLAWISKLRPVTFDWTADGTYSEGFIAHEVQEIAPYAVHGEKDAVDPDKGLVPQGLDSAKLVARLTGALQELDAKVNALEARLAAYVEAHP